MFLTTNQMSAINELRLMLRKLAWIEEINQNELRPFAFMMSPDGRTRRAAEIPIVLPGGQTAFSTI